MVSDTDVNTNETSAEKENNAMSEAASLGAEQSTAAAPEQVKRLKAKAGGKRSALRILSENVDTVAKDISGFRKNHEASAKKLEKQISQVRSELGSLKSQISKENTIATGKQEDYLSKILAKLSAGPKTERKPAKKRKKAPKK